jgi:hypothetical protein
VETKEKPPNGHDPILDRLVICEAFFPDVAAAEALAKPGLERELISQYRADFPGFLEYKREHGIPLIEDQRPMMRGYEIRSRIACLKLSPEILKRVSVGG